MSTLFDRAFGDRGSVTLDGVRLLSKPTLEIREVKGAKVPQHFGEWEFRVLHDEETFTIHIRAHTRENDIATVRAFEDGANLDLVLEPADWDVGNRSGTALFLKEIKER